MRIVISGIPIDIQKKNIKNMHLQIKPPDGHVVISAPLSMDDKAIEVYARTNLSWIKKQIEKFQQQPRSAKRQYVSGETMYIWGKQYYLSFVPDAQKNSFEIQGDKVILSMREDSTVKQRENYVREQYRSLLKVEIERLLPKWEQITELHCESWQTKYMVTRWGTCNTEKKKLWFNLQLAQKPIECLEYVILHELIHLRERTHNSTFIAYMDMYAFQILNEQGYKSIAIEQFNNTAELMAAILEKGIAIQLKRGLGKEYIPQTEALSSLRGKIDIAESIKTQSMLRKQLICTYDEFSVNSIMNRIIKSTVELLLRSNISKRRKKNLRKLMVYFSEVDFIDLYTVNWNVQYNRNNQTYRMLISICYLVVKGLLQTQSDGSTKLMDFLDEQRMCRLYEKFILEYYRREFKNQITANASQISWQLDNDENSMLPVMQSDIMLQRDDRVLIIDAKYYEHSTQVQFDKHTLHSGNLYQIFTYVKNKEYELREKQ